MPGIQRRLQVLGRQPVQPSSRLHLVQRLADEVEECLADKLHATLGIAHPHAVTDGFAGGAIAGFALAQRRLGPLAFGDVVGDQHGAGNPALDHQRRVGAGDRDLRAVLAEEHVLVPEERLAGRVDTAERAFGRRIRAAVRVTVVNGVVQLSARQLLSRPAENPLRRRVHQGDALFAVGDEDGVRRAVGDRGEQAELFGELLLGALAGGDVGAEGLERNDLAGVIEEAVEVTQVPAHLTVGPRAAGFLVPLRMLGRERRSALRGTAAARPRRRSRASACRSALPALDRKIRHTPG